MATRSSNVRLQILPESPSVQHLQIHGTKLPTHLQVLLCYLSNVDKLRQEDDSKQQKLDRIAASMTVKQVLPHYSKSRVPMVQEHKMVEKVIALHKEFANLRKLNPEKREGNPNIKKFNEKLVTTLPFWPRNALDKMEKNMVKLKTKKEKSAAKEDILFLKSMMTDRVAQYRSIDLNTSQLEVNRAKRIEREQIQQENREKRQKLDALINNASVELSGSSEDEDLLPEPIPIYTVAKRSH